MVTIPEEFSQQISEFASLFSKKVFGHAKLLLLGTILSLGRRTVCGVLRTVGLSDEKRFHKFHRVLSHAKWSCLQGSKLLLLKLVDRFGGNSQPLVFGIDETIERRWGAKIKARGIYRDAVNSSHSHFVKCSGLRWISLMLLTPIPWASRVWALPFLTVLAPSERYYESKGKQHKKVTHWARQMILQLKRWLPNRRIIIVADGGYTCYELLAAVKAGVCMITPMRLDARLFNLPGNRPQGKRGPNPIVGKPQMKLNARLTNEHTQWQEIIIPNWYGQTSKKMLVCTDIAIWYKSAMPPVTLRWVLIKDPQGLMEPKALQCTDLNLQPIDIINYFIRRWTIEVTFEEVRAHLGVETQRQWSDKAIARTTPVLMGSYSIVTLWADKLQQKQQIHVKATAWYQKSLPTFSDAMASVRKQIWRSQKFLTSDFQGDVYNFKPDIWEHLIDMISASA